MGAEDLNKRWVLVLLLVLAVAIAAVSGVVLGNLSMNASAKECSEGVVTVTIQGDSRVYASDGASIPFKWGTVQIGENTKTVTITSHANVILKPHLTVTSPNLPRGWTLTFSLDNQPIPAGRTATGTLTLKVPAHTLAGNYNWGASITFDGA